LADIPELPQHIMCLCTRVCMRKYTHTWTYRYQWD